jgi:hypothetical protein
MEMQPISVSAEELIKYVTALRIAMDDVPTSFIWNMDEMGHPNWVNARTETVYVPADLNADTIPIPMNRAGKRITLVAHALMALW